MKLKKEKDKRLTKFGGKLNTHKSQAPTMTSVSHTFVAAA